MTRIGIIGGGLAGLVCARKLVEAGLRPIVLEKERQLGGRTATEVIDGIPIDVGAKTFSKSYRRFRELVDALGLKPQIKRVPMLQEAIYTDGRVLSLANILSSDVFSRQELLQIAKLSLGGGGITWPPNDSFDALHRLSWREQLEAEGYGPGILSNFIDPLARLVTHTDSAGISAAFGRFLASLMNAPKFVLADGFQVVIDALERQLVSRAKIVTGIAVQCIVPEQGHYSLQCIASGQPSELALDVVVSTVPIPILNRLFPALPVTCSYARSVHLVVRGRRKPVLGDIYFLATTANDYGVLSCIGNQAVTTVLAKDTDYRLEFLFDEYEVIRELRYDYGIALMTPGCAVPPLEPGPEGLYLCGDFYYYPSVEASVVSAETVAQRIVSHYV